MALLMLLDTLVTFIACVLAVVTFPVTVFVFAAIMNRNEREEARRQAVSITESKPRYTVISGNM